jgi:hypothetical protein
MERRYFGLATLVIVWLIVLGVPELRGLFHQQATGEGDFGDTSNTPRFVPLAPLVRQLSPAERSLETLAKLHPNDARVQLLAEEKKRAIEATGIPGIRTFSSVATTSYDAVIARFGLQPWLIANRLRYSILPYGRVAGELEATKQTLPNGQTRFIYPPEEKPRSSRSELEANIAKARQGQKLEPDNAYFDLMLAHALLSLRRDIQALQVLREAAGKGQYEEHLFEDVQARIAVAEMEGPLLFEERIAIAAGAMLPQYARFREMARLSIWKGIQRERAGDHQGALQIYGDVAAIGARMRDAKRGLYITALVGMAIQSLAWQHGQEWTPQEQQRFTEQQASSPWLRSTVAAERFAAYARRHGREDLARQAIRDNQITIRLRQQGGNYISSSIFGVPNETLNKAFTLRWLMACLLSQLQVTLLAWVLATLMLLIARKLGQSAGDAMRKLDVNSVVSFIACITVVFLGVAAWLGLSHGMFLSGESGIYAEPLDADKNAVSLLGTLITFTPVLLGAVYCLVAGSWRHRKAVREVQQQADASRNQPSREKVNSIWQHDVTNLMVFAATWALPLATLTAWHTYLSMNGLSQLTQSQTLISPDLILPLALFLLTLLWWVAKWRWSRTPGHLNTTYTLRWYRQSMGAMLIMASIAYLAIGLYSLPARREANARVEQHIQQGEMALVRQMSTQAPS